MAVGVSVVYNPISLSTAISPCEQGEKRGRALLARIPRIWERTFASAKTTHMVPSTWTSPGIYEQVPSVALALASFASHLAASAANSALWLILGSVFSVCSCAWTQCMIGPRFHKGFRAFQPFLGGEAFILYQGHGWVWLGAELVSAAVLLANWEALAHVRAKIVILALGAMSLCPCGLVLLSIQYFCADGVSNRSSKSETEKIKMISVIGSIALSLIAWVLSYQGWPCLGIETSIVGAFIAHFHGGSNLSGWRHVQVFHGGPYFAILQGHAWTAFATSACLNLLSGLGILHGLVGVGFLAGFVQFAAVVMILASLVLFDGSGAVLKQLHLGSARALISNVFLLFAFLHFPIVSALTFTGSSSFCSSRGMNWFMLLSMPFAHFVSTYCIEGYSFFQPASGGIEFMIMQSYSWTIFGLASLTQVALTANGMCIPLLTVLLSASGWVMMALSVRYFEAPGRRISRGPAGALSMEVPRGGLADLLMALACGLGIWSALITCEVVEWNSAEGVAWMLIVAVGSCNIAGFHILWTWTHATLSVLLLVTGDELGIAIFTCIGFSLATTWYALLARFSHLQLPVCAIRGWGAWFIDAVGPLIGHRGHPEDWHPSYLQPSIILVGFHLIDTAFHLLPPLMLLQVSASLITPSSVVIAHVVGRFWFFLVSTHHYAILPKELAKNGLRVAKYQSRGRDDARAFPTALSILRGWVTGEGWVDSGVLSQIYGMDPPLPQALAKFAMTADFVSSIVMLGLALLPQPLRTHAFFTIGLGPLVSIKSILCLCTFFAVPGAVCYAVAFPLSFLNWPNPHHVHMDMYNVVFGSRKSRHEDVSTGVPTDKVAGKEQ